MSDGRTDVIPPKLRPVFDGITELTDDVCRKHLNGEYAELAREITAVLARMHPSPLLQGDRRIWACGIVYALGFANFLFDSSFEPYLSAEKLCEAFGVKKSTGYNKSKLVRDMLEMTQFDPRWRLPSLMDANPLVWMIEVDGFIVDVRQASREIQEIAYENGLIPYIPEPSENGAPSRLGKSTASDKDKQETPPDYGKKERKRKPRPEDPSQLSLDF
jgi:hypothetical protein